MIRIAHFADNHFDETHRFEETVKIHEWMTDHFREVSKPSLILGAGDLYERESTPRERWAAAGFLLRCADVAPVHLVRGNHDAKGDLELFTRIGRDGHPIDVTEGVWVDQTWAKAHADETTATAMVGLAALGWPTKANVLTQAQSRGEAADTSLQALQNILRGLGMGLDQFAPYGFDPPMPRIFLGHAMVRGSRVSTGQPLVGCDFELGLEDLALVRADAYLLGHIHFGQEWDINGAPVIYPGSPRRTAFGEVEDKCFVLLDFDGNRIVNVERVRLPAPPMLLFSDEWVPGEPGSWRSGDVYRVQPGTFQDAEVRFRYDVDADQRLAARHATDAVRAWVVDCGAAHVKIEDRVRPKVHARVPEIRAVATLPEKVELTWKSKGFDPGARRDGLLAKLARLEAEASDGH